MAKKTEEMKPHEFVTAEQLDKRLMTIWDQLERIIQGPDTGLAGLCSRIEKLEALEQDAEQPNEKLSEINMLRNRLDKLEKQLGIKR